MARRRAARAGGSVAPCLQLVAPDASSVSACQPAPANRLDVTLALAGTHTIIVRDFFNTVTGAYVVALDRIVPPSAAARAMQYGQSLIDDLGVSADLDLFVFNGSAGDVISASATRRTGSVSPCVELGSPTGVRTTACAAGPNNQVQATLT